MMFVKQKKRKCSDSTQKRVYTRFRVQLASMYKINLLTYKSLHGHAPAYLMSLITAYVPPRTLRSSSQGRLVEKRARCKRTGDRAFSVCAPQLWNSLPYSVRNCEKLSAFKTELKSYFKQAFPGDVS